jgi:hypothetical protein
MIQQNGNASPTGSSRQLKLKDIREANATKPVLQEAAKMILAVLRFSALKLFHRHVLYTSLWARPAIRRHVVLAEQLKFKTHIAEMGEIMAQRLLNNIFKAAKSTTKKNRMSTADMDAELGETRLAEVYPAISNTVKMSSEQKNDPLCSGNVTLIAGRAKVLCFLAVYYANDKKSIMASLCSYKTKIDISLKINPDLKPGLETAIVSSEGRSTEGIIKYAREIWQALQGSLPISRGVSLPKFGSKSIADFTEFVEKFGIQPRNYGKGTAKPLASFLAEVASGKCLLKIVNGELVRELNVINVMLLSGSRMLVEELRYMPNGTTKTRPSGNNFPSTTMNSAEVAMLHIRDKNGHTVWSKVIEGVKHAAMRCIAKAFKDDFCIPETHIAFKSDSLAFTVKSRYSGAYPGVKTTYNVYQIQADINWVAMQRLNPKIQAQRVLEILGKLHATPAHRTKRRMTKEDRAAHIITSAIRGAGSLKQALEMRAEQAKRKMVRDTAQALLEAKPFHTVESSSIGDTTHQWGWVLRSRSWSTLRKDLELPALIQAKAVLAFNRRMSQAPRSLAKIKRAKIQPGSASRSMS